MVDISYSGDPESVIEEVRTDSTGRTDTVALEAPPLEYSLSPGEQQPYSEYTFSVSAGGL